MAAKNPEAAKPDSVQELFMKYEEEPSPEFQNLIANLPKHFDRLSDDHLYQYQGFWNLKRVIQGILNCQSHFQAHDADIIIVTPPKCGTTWLKALTFALINRKTCNMNPNVDPIETMAPDPLLTTNPHDLVPNFEFQLYFNTDNPDLSSLPSPRLFSSHLAYISLPESVKHSRCKILYLCRNPKDVFVSLWNFLNRLRPEVQELNTIEYLFGEFCRGENSCGPFWDHVLGYYKESLKKPE